MLSGPVARFTIRVTDRKPRVRGPAAMHRFACGDSLVVERPLLALRALFTPGLEGWRGSTALRVSRLQAGRQSLAAFQGHMTFNGDARATAGDVEILSGDAAAGGFRARQARLAGRYRVERPQGLSFEGTLAARGLTADAGRLAAIAAGLRGARATPLGPIAEQLAQAVMRAGRGGAEAGANLRLSVTPGSGALNLNALRIESASGARLIATGGEGIE